MTKPEEKSPFLGSEMTAMNRVNLSEGPLDLLSARHFLRKFPPHFHDTYAIGVVESGLTKLYTLEGEWIARPGTILAFSPGEIHAADPLTVEGFSYRMVYPSRDLMRSLGLDVSGGERTSPLFRAPVLEDAEMAALLSRAHLPLMNGDVGSHAEGLLVAGLRGLATRHGRNSIALSYERARDLEVVEHVKRLLHAAVGEPVRLTTVAASCGLSPFQLIRLFRRVVGVPPHAYLVQLRVNRAQALLGEGLAVAAAANFCGFSDQSHLTRTFRKAVGIPPGKYRRASRRGAA